MNGSNNLENVRLAKLIGYVEVGYAEAQSSNMFTQSPLLPGQPAGPIWRTPRGLRTTTLPNFLSDRSAVREIEEFITRQPRAVQNDFENALQTCKKVERGSKITFSEDRRSSEPGDICRAAVIALEADQTLRT